MALMQVHYRQEIAQETKDLWWTSLSDMPDDIYRATVHRAMREEEHFPLPGTLRRFADEMRTLRDEAQTPYHLRALPSPDEQAVMRLHTARAWEACPNKGDPAVVAAWEAKVAAARERWALVRTA
jgi:hypothetical protein